MPYVTKHGSMQEHKETWTAARKHLQDWARASREAATSREVAVLREAAPREVAASREAASRVGSLTAQKKFHRD
jgi:hypothetical protein